MKNIRTIIAITISFVSAACTNSPTKEIEAAAQGYLDAMGNYRIDEAAPYATQQTREKTIPAFNFIMEHSDSAYINSNKPATITIHNTRMLSDTSARVYYHKSTPIKEVDDSVDLLLEEGQWLVDVQVNLPSMSTTPKRKTTPAVDPSTIRRVPLTAAQLDSLRRRQPH